MKKTKKLLSILVAATMTMAMAAPSFAATINLTPAGATTGTEGHPLTQTYHAYKIFDLASVSGNNYSYYLANYASNPWKSFIDDYPGTLEGDKAFKLNDNGYVMATSITANSSEAAAFAKAAAAYAVKNNIAGIEQTATNGTQVTWDNLEQGYYVIDSTVGSLCILGTNNTVLNLTDKNVAPSLTKNTENGSANVQVGETASYRIVVSAGNGAENYILTDTMSEALTFVEGSVKVYKVENGQENAVFGDNDNRLISEAGNYKVDKTSNGFKITFDNTATAGWTSNDKIVVIYDAKVNANAATGTAITNKAKLTYGDGTDTPDTPDVTSKTYQFDLQKTTMNADGSATNTQLSGAEFSLYTSDAANATALQLVELGDTVDAKGNTVKVYRVATADDSTTTPTITVGYAVIKGLDDDTTYYLEETKSPDGYNLLTGKVKVTGLVEVNNQLSATPTKIANSTGALLPSTGGIGTTIFYAAGIILMAGAVFFVVRRKKA